MSALPFWLASPPTGCSNGISFACSGWLPRPCDNDRGACEAQNRAGDVPAIGAQLFDAPQPCERCGNVDAAIRGIGSARSGAFNEREQVREQQQRERAGKDPPHRLVQAQPCPKGEASCDL